MVVPLQRHGFIITWQWNDHFYDFIITNINGVIVLWFYCICRMNRYELQQFKKNNFFIPMESLIVVHYRWNHQRINFIGMFQRVGKTLHLHAIDYYRWNDRHINSIIKFQRVKNIAPPCHRPLHMESSTD